MNGMDWCGVWDGEKRGDGKEKDVGDDFTGILPRAISRLDLGLNRE